MVRQYNCRSYMNEISTERKRDACALCCVFRKWGHLRCVCDDE